MSPVIRPKRCSSCGKTKDPNMFSSGKVTCDNCRARKQKERKIVLEQRQSTDQQREDEIESTRMLVGFLQTQLDVRNQQVVDLVSHVNALNARLAATQQSTPGVAATNTDALIIAADDQRALVPAAKRRKVIAVGHHEHDIVGRSTEAKIVPPLGDVLNTFPVERSQDAELVGNSSTGSDCGSEAMSLLAQQQQQTSNNVLTSGSEQNNNKQTSHLRNMTHSRSQPANQASRQAQGQMSNGVISENMSSFLV